MGNTSRYDLVLIGIAITIVAMGIGMYTSSALIGAAGLVALAILAYGLFIAPPLDRKV